MNELSVFVYGQKAGFITSTLSDFEWIGNGQMFVNLIVLFIHSFICKAKGFRSPYMCCKHNSILGVLPDVLPD